MAVIKAQSAASLIKEAIVLDLGDLGRQAAKMQAAFESKARQTIADAEREVDADGSSGNGFDRLNGALLSEAHDRTLAELLFDLTDGQIHGLEALPVLAIFSSIFSFAGPVNWHGDSLLLVAARNGPRIREAPLF